MASCQGAIPLQTSSSSLSTILPILLQYQLLLKIFHWQTTSYDLCNASKTIYDRLSEFINTIVEYDQCANSTFSICGENSTFFICFERRFILQNMDDDDAVFLLQQLSLFLDLMVIKDKGIRLRRDDLIVYIHKALFLFK
jgi:hypothetical protein